jgi:hypothetical protein
MTVLTRFFLFTNFISILIASDNSFLLEGESRYVLTENESVDDVRLICKNEAILNMTQNIVMLPPEAIKIDCLVRNLFDLTLVEESINENLLYVKYEAKINTSALFDTCSK